LISASPSPLFLLPAHRPPLETLAGNLQFFNILRIFVDYASATVTAGALRAAIDANSCKLVRYLTSQADLQALRLNLERSTVAIGALHYVATHCGDSHLGVAKLLLHNGYVDVKDTNSIGETALEIAERRRGHDNRALIRLLDQHRPTECIIA
jgi:Ankyrin repeat